MRAKILFLIILFMGTFHELFSQGLCDRSGGGFSLDVSEGCAPLKVNISNEITNAIDYGYLTTYNGTSTDNLAFTDKLSSAIYSSSGTFIILQKVVTSAGQFYACKNIKVYESRAINAQYSSCGGTKVFVTLTNDAILKSYDKVEIDWGDGSSATWVNGDALSLDHNYINTTIKPIVKITGKYINGQPCTTGLVRSISVVFQQAQLSEIAINKLEMRGNGTLEINYLGVTGISTDLLYSTNPNGTYTKASTRSSGGLQVARINGLDPSKVYYIKLGSKDLCGGQLDSDVVSTVVLKGKSENENNVLTWNEYSNPTGFIGYDLYKEGAVIASITNIKATSFSDDNVQCGDVFEYQLVAKIEKVNTSSAPLNLKTVVYDLLPLDKGLVSVLDEAAVAINIGIPSGKSSYELLIEKAENMDSKFKRLVTLYNENEYVDLDVNTNNVSYCYRVTYQNACGQKTLPSKPICTINLQLALSTLNWSTGNPFIETLDSYTVIQTAKSNSEIPVKLSTSYLPDFGSTDDLEYIFRIKARSGDGSIESFSNSILISRNTEVFIPEAFSPDDDGINDYFIANAKQLKSFDLFVYNQWGQVIFHTDDIAVGWDGTYKGAQVPVGSYIYRIQLVDIIDQKQEKRGTFMLLR